MPSVAAANPDVAGSTSASAVHEIGHFLGLGHPDNIPNNWFDHPITLPTPGQNSYQTFLASGGRMNSSYCRMAQLWDDVKPGVPPDSEIDLEIKTAKYPVVDSQMEAIAQFNPRTCLTDDDLDGLSVLYPDCSDISLSVNVCHKVQHNIGSVRVAVYVLGPLIIALLCVMLFNSIMHEFERRRKRGIMEALRESKKAIAKDKVVNRMKLAAIKASAASQKERQSSERVQLHVQAEVDRISSTSEADPISLS